MKKVIALLFIAGTLSYNVSAQEIAKMKQEATPAILEIKEGGVLENANAPVIEFTEETHDFGELNEGPQATYDFILKNTGKEPLIIASAKGSCGCTIPEWPQTPVLPGAEAKIHVKYNTQGRVGPFNKAVTITSNASEPTKRVYIKGTVIKQAIEDTTPVKQPSIVNEKSSN